jgi:hypothetical protein
MLKVSEDELFNLLDNIESETNFNIIEYLNNKDKRYSQALCTGKENIPTPKMFDKIIEGNKSLLRLTPVLKEQLETLKQSSLEFYTNLIKALHRTWHEKVVFENEFDKNVQPHGQKFVNNLKVLKYKIDELRIDNPKIFFKSLKTMPENIIERNFKFKGVRKMILRMKKALAFHPQTSYKAYIAITTLSVVLAGIGGFILAESVTNLERASLAASYASLAVLILFMASFTVQLFEYTDISGRNVLACNYKTLLNSAIYRAKHEHN